MKKAITLLMTLMLACSMCLSACADVQIEGKWAEVMDLAKEFGYTKGDVTATADMIWTFAAVDGACTVTECFADPAAVRPVAINLMTAILTAEIAAEGATISTVAKDEGFSSVAAFVESIFKKEGLDTMLQGTEQGTYQLTDNTLTISWNAGSLQENASVTYTVAIEGDTMTLTNNADGSSVTLIRLAE